MKKFRLEKSELDEEASKRSNDAQRKTLESCLKLGWNVRQVITTPKGSVINVSTKEMGAWITLDGKLHRPVKGKTTVSIDPNTLERIW